MSKIEGWSRTREEHTGHGLDLSMAEQFVRSILTNKYIVMSFEES
jgi:hypothetical protein